MSVESLISAFIPPESTSRIPTSSVSKNYLFEFLPNIKVHAVSTAQIPYVPRNGPWIYEICTRRGFDIHPELQIPSFWGGPWPSVPTPAKAAIRAGKMVLLLSSLPESSSPSSIRSLYHSLRENGAPLNQCVIMSSGLYRNAAIAGIRQNIGTDIIQAPWFEIDTLRDHQKNLRPYLEALPPTRDEKGRPIFRSKAYIMLNRRIEGAPHRIAAYLDLLRRDIVSHGHISMPWQCLNSPTKTFYDRIDEIKLLQQTQWDRRVIDLIRFGKKMFATGPGLHLPRKLDVSFENDDVRKMEVVASDYHSGIIRDFYADAYFSVVTEGYTRYGGPDDFSSPSMISEKVFFPMMNFHPFIIIGEPFSLERLRDHGYQTFSKWFDESYDRIEDPLDRISAAIDVVEELSNRPREVLHTMFEDMLPVLQHNRNRVKERVAQFAQDLASGKLLPSSHHAQI
jgi:hypothetical protein